MNNCTIVLFGISGDLAKRKIIPALYYMLERNKLKKFLLIGAALDEYTVPELLERSKEFIGTVDQRLWNILLENTFYKTLDFNNALDYDELKLLIEAEERKRQMSGNRIIYLAAAAHFFCPITTHIAASGIAKRSEKHADFWHRIIYEKPFGHDLSSAQVINRCIHASFNENQIYRIDHFLSKELVSNIALVRFTNIIFEPLWNSNYIDNVQILLSESIGIEGRGTYYDQYGVLCDVVQNHMLEMLALIAMEAPEKLTGDYIRNERAKVLDSIVFKDGILGQYHGYRKENHVAPLSKTETFASLYVTVDNERWKGVPFYLKAGKKLTKKETVIHIQFKPVTCLLTEGACPTEGNYLTIEIAPDQGFSLTLNAKKVGFVDQVMPIKMEFCHSCLYGPLVPEDYEVLFEEVIKGEQSIAVRIDEIESAWKIIDTIKKNTLPVYEYAQGSQGPEELKEFEKKHSMRWKS